MTDTDDSAQLPDPARSGWPAILSIVALCTGIEAILLLADLRLLDPPYLRLLAMQYGAFWPGLLHGWQPNYVLQPVAMFVTYAFLHAGFGHLAGNMLALLALGRAVAAQAGQAGFVVVYAASVLGGGAVFGALSSGPQPMVGASGALFGLVGALQYWRLAETRRWRTVFQVIALLVALNALLWILLEGTLAWQTHLGGFCAGWLTALLLRCIAPNRYTPNTRNTPGDP